MTDNLISEAIVGQFNISGEETEEFISGTKTDRVKEISMALQELNFETYIDKFDMSAFSQNDNLQSFPFIFPPYFTVFFSTFVSTADFEFSASPTSVQSFSATSSLLQIPI